MTPSPVELKPCPFCGGSAAFGEVTDEEMYPSEFGGQFIYCTNKSCACTTALIFPLMDDAEDLLIERWNRRAEHIGI